jgi:hypothetical protein
LQFVNRSGRHANHIISTSPREFFVVLDDRGSGTF